MLAVVKVVGQGITWLRKGRWWDKELQRLQDGNRLSRMASERTSAH